MSGYTNAGTCLTRASSERYESPHMPLPPVGVGQLPGRLRSGPARQSGPGTRSIDFDVACRSHVYERAGWRANGTGSRQEPNVALRDNHCASVADGGPVA